MHVIIFFFRIDIKRETVANALSNVKKNGKIVFKIRPLVYDDDDGDTLDGELIQT